MTQERERGGKAIGGTKVKAPTVGEEGRVLGSGVDSLELAVDVFWLKADFLNTLKALKEEACKSKSEMPSSLKGEGFEWSFRVRTHGRDGYEWILESAEYHVVIGSWMTPRSRPSILIKIYCQTLWLYGVIESVDRILTLLTCAGAKVNEAKLSRVDLCVDILLPKSLWKFHLIKHRVTWAEKYAFHGAQNDVSGFTIGQGGMFSARLYDKEREIRDVSKKFWMFDVWQIKEVPKSCRVIRVEFQLRREAILELGMSSVWSFVNNPRNVWAYCTRTWLKFQDNPKLHHTLQSTLPFWVTVQNGFLGGQEEQPVLRAKMVNVKREQLSQQLMGQLTSLISIDNHDIEPKLKVEEQLPVVTRSAALIGMNDDGLSEKVRRKKGKYLKAIKKFKEIEEDRKALDLPRRNLRDAGYP
jgi:hypothetical protein